MRLAPSSDGNWFISASSTHLPTTPSPSKPKPAYFHSYGSPHYPQFHSSSDLSRANSEGTADEPITFAPGDVLGRNESFSSCTTETDPGLGMSNRYPTSRYGAMRGIKMPALTIYDVPEDAEVAFSSANGEGPLVLRPNRLSFTGNCPTQLHIYPPSSPVINITRSASVADGESGWQGDDEECVSRRPLSVLPPNYFQATGLHVRNPSSREGTSHVPPPSSTPLPNYSGGNHAPGPDLLPSFDGSDAPPSSSICSSEKPQPQRTQDRSPPRDPPPARRALPSLPPTSAGPRSSTVPTPRKRRSLSPIQATSSPNYEDDGERLHQYASFHGTQGLYTEEFSTLFRPTAP